MSLGRKLFLLVGGLLCLLLGGQWLLFRALSREVSEDVRTVAFRVGADIVSGFSFRTDQPADARERAGDPTPRGGGQGRVFVVITEEPEIKAGAETEKGAADGASGASAVPERTIVLHKELRWKSVDDARPEAGLPRSPLPSPGEVERFVIAADENEDRLFVRGPAIERSIPIPAAQVASTLDRFGSRMLFGSLALLAVGLTAAAFLAQRMSRPLSELAFAAERVGGGELGLKVPESVGSPRDEVGRAVASFNSMSARLATLDQENRRLAEAEQLSELGDVARGLAHSLRNPLNALGLSIERLGARAAESASASELVEGSRRQIRRIDGALRSFLALASAGAAQAQAVDLAALAREVALEALQDSGEGTKIEVESASAERVVVLGVAAELKAVLQALVINACEAAARIEGPDQIVNGSAAQHETVRSVMPGAQVTIRIKAGSARNSQGVTVEVEDNGPGLPEGIRERLFEPHVTTKAHGSGIGLFLAHRMATARYRGALRLEPRAAGGTRAVVELSNRQGPPA